MIHPVFTKLASQPGLFAEHIGAYAELVVAETRQFGANWKARLLLAAISASSGVVALVVSAIAGMLVAAHGWNNLVEPWVVVAVPAVFWLVSIACALLARRVKMSPMFSTVREQLGADLELLNRAGKV